MVKMVKIKFKCPITGKEREEEFDSYSEFSDFMSLGLTFEEWVAPLTHLSKEKRERVLTSAFLPLFKKY